MKRYNKFYNVSLGNFLKVACCSLSIITIASCEEEPFEEQESNNKSDLQKAASDFRAALKNTDSCISIDDLDNITSLDSQKAQNLCENLEKITKDESITDKLKGLAARLLSKCKKFFGVEKEENKPTDDNPSQAEPKLNIAEEWKKVEEAVENLKTKYKSLGKGHYCPPLDSIIYLGNVLNDVEVVCANLKERGKDVNSDKEVFQKHKDVLDLIDKVVFEINAFIDKFDKSEPAGGSPSQEESKLNKAKEWKKVEDAAQKLITKYQSFKFGGMQYTHLNSFIDNGKSLCADDGALTDFKSALTVLVSDKSEVKKNQTSFNLTSTDVTEVLDLINKIEYESNAFINKFYKSKPAVDSKVSQ